MSFIFRAAFWFAVVGAFMPREALVAPGSDASIESHGDMFDAVAATDAMCARQREVCEAGAEAATVARIAGRYAAERTADALSSSH